MPNLAHPSWAPPHLPPDVPLPCLGKPVLIKLPVLANLASALRQVVKKMNSRERARRWSQLPGKAARKRKLDIKRLENPMARELSRLRQALYRLSVNGKVSAVKKQRTWRAKLKAENHHKYERIKKDNRLRARWWWKENKEKVNAERRKSYEEHGWMGGKVMVPNRPDMQKIIADREAASELARRSEMEKDAKEHAEFRKIMAKSDEIGRAEAMSRRLTISAIHREPLKKRC